MHNNGKICQFWHDIVTTRRYIHPSYEIVCWARLLFTFRMSLSEIRSCQSNTEVTYWTAAIVLQTCRFSHVSRESSILKLLREQYTHVFVWQLNLFCHKTSYLQRGNARAHTCGKKPWLARLGRGLIFFYNETSWIMPGSSMVFSQLNWSRDLSIIGRVA